MALVRSNRIAVAMVAIAALCTISPVAVTGFWLINGHYVIAGAQLTFLRLAWPGGPIGMALALAAWALARGNRVLRWTALAIFVLAGLSSAYVAHIGL